MAAAYFSVVTFLPLLQAGTDGHGHGHLAASVIVISSMSAAARPGLLLVQRGQLGHAHLAKMMSAGFQKARARVNSIAPGYFSSEMMAKESGPDMKSELPTEYVRKRHVPAQRAGANEEMAQEVVSWPLFSEYRVHLGEDCADSSLAVHGEECLGER